jgi:hypothetical protein
MSKKFFFIGTLALLGAALLLSGCPTDAEAGDPGAAGKNGENGQAGYPVLSTGALDDGTWAGVFVGNDKVRLLSGVTSIEGTIPAGKTVEIAGTVSVAASKTLTIRGTVSIFETGAVGSGGGSDIVLGENGVLQVDGSVFAAAGLFTEEGLAEGVSLGAKSAVDADSGGDVAAVNGLFTVGVSRVTTANASILNDVTALDKWTAGKTLITEAAISPATGLDLSTVQGNLAIRGALTLGAGTLTATGGNTTVESAGSIVLGNAGSALAGAIKVYGTLSVGTGVTAAIPATVDLSEGTVASTTTASLVFPAAALSVGTIGLGGALTFTGLNGITVTEITNSAAATLTLPAITADVKRIVADDSAALTIAGGAASVTLKAEGVSGAGGLVLGTNAVIDGNVTVASTSSITGARAAFGADAEAQAAQLAKISGGSTVISGEVSDAAAIAAFAAVATTKVTATGSATDLGDVAITVAAGNDITLSGVVTKTPAITVNGTLTLSAAATFAEATGLITVNGTLNVGAGATGFAPPSDIIVNEKGTLTVAGTLDAQGAVAVGSTDTVTLTKATVTGTASGTTLVGSSGTVTLAADAVLTLADGGAIAIAGSGSVVTGATTFSGGGTWTASVTGGDITGVKITSGASGIGATIAAVGATGTGTLTAGGSGSPAPVITQAAGTAGNSLTIAANTVIALGGDGTAVGSIVLTGADSNPGKLTFANHGTSDVGTSLVTTAATSADNKVTGTVSAPATGTALVWYAVSDVSSGGKWSKLGASAETNGLVGGSGTTNVTLSGASAVTAA